MICWVCTCPVTGPEPATRTVGGEPVCSDCEALIDR